jgi:hypothetical protein
MSIPPFMILGVKNKRVFSEKFSVFSEDAIARTVAYCVSRVRAESGVHRPSVGREMGVGQHGSEGVLPGCLTHALKCGDNERFSDQLVSTRIISGYLGLRNQNSGVRSQNPEGRLKASGSMKRMSCVNEEDELGIKGAGESWRADDGRESRRECQGQPRQMGVNGS